MHQSMRVTITITRECTKHTSHHNIHITISGLAGGVFANKATGKAAKIPLFNL